MEKFLRDRGLPEENIDKMRDDKNCASDDGEENKFEATDTPTIFFRKSRPGQSAEQTTETSSPESTVTSCITLVPSTSTSVPLPNSSSPALDNNREKSDLDTFSSATDPLLNETPALEITVGKSNEDSLLPTNSMLPQLAQGAGTSGQPTLCTEEVQLLCDDKEEVDLWEFGVDTGPSELNMQAILKWWQRRTLVHESDPRQLLVCRTDLLKSTLRVVRRETFNFCAQFKVCFSGEDGDDIGGPKREFLRLLMTEVCACIFQGPEGQKFFYHDLEKLSRGTYEVAGRLVAFSLLHGGPGIPVLHSVVYDILMNGEDAKSELPAVEDCIFDLEMRQKLISLQNAIGQIEYEKSLEEISDWCLENSLCVGNYRKVSEKERLLTILKKNEIFYRVQSEIVQLRNGLSRVGGFLETVQLAPSAMRPLFVSGGKSLTFQEFKALYTVQWSAEGSNDRTKEEKALYCLEAFLADCEEGVTEVKLEEMLAFWTGASEVPPLGFDKELEVTFSSSKQLPTAHSCGLVLTIWRGFDDPDEFGEAITKSVKWAGGFHLV